MWSRAWVSLPVLVLTLWCVPRISAQIPESPPRVQIMELSAEPESGVPEFVELLIAGTAPLAPDRLAIRDDRPTWRVLPFDIHPFLPGQTAVLTPDSVAFREAYGALPETARLMEVRPWPALNNGGDSLVVAIDGRVVERAAYDGAIVERGFTAERVSANAPSLLPSNWRASRLAGGTPGAPNSVHHDDDSPPYIIGAELVGSNSIWLWMSEAMWPTGTSDVSLDGQPVPASVAFGGRLVSTRVVVTTGTWSHTRGALIAGIRDPSGNLMAPQRVHVARPAQHGDILISEVMTRGSPDWIEISAVESTDASVSLRQIRLGYAGKSTAVVAADSSLILAPGSSMIQEADLSSTGVDLVLYAIDEAGTHVRLDSVRLSPGDEDPRFADHRERSMVRIGGGARDWASSIAPPSSPGLDTGRESRRRAPPTPFRGLAVMTEVMFDPLMDQDDGKPDQTEFVEWTMEAPIDLYGAYMTYGVNERGATDTLRTGYQPMPVAAGQSVVVAYIPSHVSDAADAPVSFLQAGWPAVRPDVAILPTRQSLGLRNAGRRLTLHARDGTVLGDDTYTADMHHSALPTTKGISLSRMRIGNAWGPLYSTAAPNGATPGFTTGAADDSARDRVAGGDHRAWLAPASIYPKHSEWGAQTHIALETALPATVTSAVYDLEGRRIRQLAQEQYVNGSEALSWDGRDDSGNVVRAGLYVVFVRFSSASTNAFKLPVAVLVR